MVLNCKFVKRYKILRQNSKLMTLDLQLCYFAEQIFWKSLKIFAERARETLCLNKYKFCLLIEDFIYLKIRKVKYCCMSIIQHF